LLAHGARDWRELIGEAVTAIWPSLPDGPLWIEAQVDAESAGDPQAVSPAGAQGLLQLMPGTATEVGVSNPFDPRENVLGGVTYLRRQFDRLDDVPDELDRLLWAFAAYNAGLGYVWRALHCAEEDKRLPGADRWWVWDLSWRYFPHRRAELRGKWADYHQVTTYVGRIRTKAAALGARVR
jgi:membrane-bound lytic murein transglycosylase MltF